MNPRNPQSNKLAELTEEQIAGLYKRVFETTEGQLVLEDLRFRSFVYVPTFEGDAQKGIFNEGKRSTVLHIESQIAYVPKPERKDD